MELIAKGNSAEIYKQNENQICKLFYKNYPKQLVEHEFNNAKIIYQLGINTPFPYDIVFIEERYGIIYEKLNGTTLLSKINTENTNVDFWIEKFVNLHKDLEIEFLNCPVGQHGIDVVIQQLRRMNSFKNPH